MLGLMPSIKKKSFSPPCENAEIKWQSANLEEALTNTESADILVPWSWNLRLPEL